MSWEVTSRVRGGVPLSVADAQQFHALIATLTDTSRQFAAQSAAWATLSDQLTRTRLHVSSCPVHRDSWPGGSLTAAAMPRLSFIVELSRACEAQIRVCSAIAQHMDALTQLVARAQGLYLDAETKAAHASAGIPTDPLSTASSVLRGMASDILRSIGVVATSDDKSQTLLDILHTTSPYHQALMRGFSIAVLAGIARSRAIRPGSGMTAIDPLHGMLSRNSVNVAAEHLASISMQLNDRRQGNRIELSRRYPAWQVTRQADGVAGAIVQLRSLAENQYGTGEDNGLSYATIAIQRYRRMDGSAAWLVIIPGTDGHADSPFGWPQNVELMSSQARTRMQADSARMVLEAMERSGIGQDDPVAIIGHSQGGIVAATLASDSKYNIRHIVTAGSPVANHPISGDTWTTSIEMDDELVPALDGAANPVGERWLTIHGSVAETVHGNGTGPVLAEPVPETADARQMSHHLKFHQAAYANAAALGSGAVTSHDRHFRQVIAGELEETSYWQGRMMH